MIFVNSKGDILTDEENNLTEQEVIDFYIKNNENITDEFFEDSTDEEEIITSEIEKDEISKLQMYNDLIEGYELSLELETDEVKITMYKDLIEGYQLALELEN